MYHDMCKPYRQVQLASKEHIIVFRMTCSHISLYIGVHNKYVSQINIFMMICCLYVYHYISICISMIFHTYQYTYHHKRSQRSPHINTISSLYYTFHTTYQTIIPFHTTYHHSIFGSPYNISPHISTLAHISSNISTKDHSTYQHWVKFSAL